MDLKPAQAINGKNNVMANLTPEELQPIKELHSKYNQTVFEMGIIETQILTFEKNIEKLREDKKGLLSDLSTIEQKEAELVATLQAKYGTGAINPETGEITAAQ